MANTQTSVPAFTAGQVLTAAQMTEVNTGIPVFATTTTRDAAFGGTGEKTLAEGQFAYIEASDTTQYYDGSNWQTVGASGLTLISATTIGNAVSSVTVSSAFSSTYDTYKIIVTGGVASAVGNLKFHLGSTTAGYYGGMTAQTYNSGYGGATINNQASNLYAGYGDNTSLVMNMDVINPNLAEKTYMASITARSGDAFGMSFVEEGSTTQHTAFTITPASGTLTGGTIRVYGYRNS